MFEDCMLLLKNTIIRVGEVMFDLLDRFGCVGYIICFSIVGLFVSYLILARSDGITLFSDMVSAGRSDRAQRDREVSQWYANGHDPVTDQIIREVNGKDYF